MYIHNSTSCYQIQYLRGTCRVLGVLTLVIVPISLAFTITRTMYIFHKPKQSI